MRARARAIGAKFNLRSAPGAGTTIELIVPHV
jgi:signal transduction histidine kinase